MDVKTNFEINYLNSLPPELVFEILDKLEFNDIFELFQNGLNHNLTSSNYNYYWENRVKREFPNFIAKYKTLDNIRDNVKNIIQRRYKFREKNKELNNIKLHNWYQVYLFIIKYILIDNNSLKDIINYSSGNTDMPELKSFSVFKYAIELYSKSNRYMIKYQDVVSFGLEVLELSKNKNIYLDDNILNDLFYSRNYELYAKLVLYYLNLLNPALSLSQSHDVIYHIYENKNLFWQYINFLVKTYKPAILAELFKYTGNNDILDIISADDLAKILTMAKSLAKYIYKYVLESKSADKLIPVVLDYAPSPLSDLI